MNYPKYEYVIAIAKTQSISKAAAELYISQPALTKFITKLESELGVKLFNRGTIPITLTFAGEKFVEKAQKIIEIQHNLDKEMEEISKMQKGRLTIGVSASRGEGWLPFILPIFSRKYPNIELRIVEGSFSHLEKLMEQGAIDIVLIATPLDSDKLDYTVLTEERVYLIASSGHPFLRGVDLTKNSLDNPLFIDPRRLDGQDMICLFPGMGMRRILDDLCEIHDIQPNIVLETQSADTAYKLALAGVGLTFAPETCVTAYFPSYVPVICTIDKTPLSRKSVACYRKGSYLSLATKTFIDELRALLHSQCPKFVPPSQEQFEIIRSDLSRYSPITAWFESIRSGQSDSEAR